MAPVVGDHADRHRHEWNAVQLPAPILAKEVAGATILLRGPVRDERVEHADDLRTGLRDERRGDDEDEVVAPDVSDEAVLAADALHDVVENLGEDPDDAIAVVVRVAIVELLEVVEVGVAHREADPA